MRKSIQIAAIGVMALAWNAGAQDRPAGTGNPDIMKAVQCQTLFVQFSDRVAASKAADDVKKAARDLNAAGNKACNEKAFDAGMEQIRQALTTLEVKPLH